MAIESDFKTIFLFGAGASLPANIPDIKKLTDDFFDTMNKSETMRPLRDKIEVLKNVTSDHFSKRKDLESFLTLIKKLGDEEERNLLHSKYGELRGITSEELDCINRAAQSFMREN